MQNTHWKGWNGVGRLNDCVKICFFTSIIKEPGGIAEKPTEGYLFIGFFPSCSVQELDLSSGVDLVLSEAFCICSDHIHY